MQTLPAFFFRTIRNHPHRAALIAWRDGGWQTSSWLQFGNDVDRTVRKLAESGIRNGDRIVLVSENRYEWPVLDLAIQLAGAISVPLNPLMSPPQLRSLIAHCEPALIMVASQELAEKIPGTASSHTPVLIIDELEGWLDSPAARLQSGFDELAWRHLEWLETLASQLLTPAALFSILYTSGTTGEPRGVILDQRNVVSNALAKVQTLNLGVDDVRVCWLPMSHIFSRLADLSTAWLTGCTSVISRGRDSLFEEFSRWQPTYLNGVPWLYDKCCRMVNSPDELKQVLGGRIRICNCGGAPLPRHVIETFASGNVTLVNGYGLTEASPVVSSNSPEHNRPGSVGRAVPGVSIRTDSDGVIHVAGPNVMQGYYRDEPASRAVLDDGWLNTGDLGSIDADGFLWITGRKKELIVTSTGRNIAPFAIENRLLTCPLILQCMVVGDNQPCLAALVVVNTQHPEVQQAMATGSSGLPALRERLLEHADLVLADVAPWEQIADVLILESPFSVENGLATPKQSLRRSEIAARFSREIDKLFSTIRLSKERDQSRPAGNSPR